MNYLIGKILLLCQIYAQIIHLPAIIVQTKYGRIRGTTLWSRNERSFFAFKGIPYASPPVGNLRFAAPTPPKSWRYVRDATNDGPMCIQKNYLFSNNPEVEGSEDCLYLNVYTPKIPTSNDEKLLPVMVFVHYGGFFAGSAHSDLIGPEYLLDKDVVLVTFNYRLGVFGFLSTNDDASPGNWGLKDQVAALKWVKDNIRAFGGNNKKVTIFGQSAGSASVHYHILSPASSSLFQGAISESGTSLLLWAKPQNLLQAMVAKKQAEFVGCDSKVNTTNMIDCLRKVDGFKLANSIEKFKFFGTEPYTIYAPVLEKRSASNPHPFMTKQPLDVIRSGEFSKVPWIVGIVSGEGILRAAPLLRQSITRNQLNGNFSTIAPLLLGLQLSVIPEQIIPTWQNITDFYLKGDNYVDVTDSEKVQGFINLYTDRVFLYGTYQTVLLHASKGHTPIWLYNFDYKGSDSYGDLFAATEEDIEYDWGVSHCDDLLYILSSKKLFPNFPQNIHDSNMSETMVRLWSNFATYQNPVPVNEVTSCSDIEWPSLPNLSGSKRIDNSDLIHLQIKGPFETPYGKSIRFDIHNQFYPERMSFWQKLPLFENIDEIS